MAAHQIHPRADGRHPRTVRGVAAHAWHAHAVSACSGGVRQRADDRAALRSGMPLIKEVLYPGLPVVPGPRGRFPADARRLWRHAVDPRARTAKRPPSPPRQTCELWKRATSLGGVESLLEHRASVEGAGTPAPADLLRLSVGDRGRRRSHCRSRARARAGAFVTVRRASNLTAGHSARRTGARYSCR